MSMYNDPSDALGPSELDDSIYATNMAETIAGGPLDEKPEFRQHQCWRMLHAYADDVDPTIPGAIECAGCGARYRVELEYKP